MKTFAATALPAVLFLLTSPAHSSNLRTRFAPIHIYSSGNGYGAAATAAQDLNGDGKIDVVVANTCVNQNDCGHGSVSVLLGNGDGTFQAPAIYLSGDGDATSLAIADVNHDGIPDIVVGNMCADQFCNSSTVGVLIGVGNGTFKAAVTYPSLTRMAALAVGDLNHDGSPDLIVGSGVSGLIGVMMNDGSGKFSAPVTYQTGQPAPGVSFIAIQDLNGDHKPDVVVANLNINTFDSGSIGILLGNGDGTLQAATNYSSGGSQPYALVIQDVNGDGKPDLLVSNFCTGSPGGSCAPSTVGVLFGNGDGTFLKAVDYNSGGRRSTTISSTDMNGDGVPDLVVMNFGNDKLGILLGNTDGTFQETDEYKAIGDSSAVGDLDGDGRPDVITAFNSEIRVLMNITVAPTTTTVATSGTPSHLNQSVSFTATVASIDGSIPDGETVNFLDQKTMIGTGTIFGGIATFTTSSLAVGTHTIHARYPGHGFFRASAGSVKQIVVP